jgi:hypothetical protein
MNGQFVGNFCVLMRVWAQIYTARSRHNVRRLFCSIALDERDLCNLYGLHVRRFLRVSPDHILDERERTVTLFSPAAHIHVSRFLDPGLVQLCVCRVVHMDAFSFNALSQSLLCINHKRSQLNLIWKQSDLKNTLTPTVKSH